MTSIAAAAPPPTMTNTIPRIGPARSSEPSTTTPADRPLASRDIPDNFPVEAEAGRASGLDAEAQVAATKARLQSLVEDPDYWRHHKPDAVARATKAFEAAYGGGRGTDATGKLIRTDPKPIDFAAFETQPKKEEYGANASASRRTATASSDFAGRPERPKTQPIAPIDFEDWQNGAQFVPMTKSRPKNPETGCVPQPDGRIDTLGYDPDTELATIEFARILPPVIQRPPMAPRAPTQPRTTPRSEQEQGRSRNNPSYPDRSGRDDSNSAPSDSIDHNPETDRGRMREIVLPHNIDEQGMRDLGLRPDPRFGTENSPEPGSRLDIPLTSYNPHGRPGDPRTLQTTEDVAKAIAKECKDVMKDGIFTYVYGGPNSENLKEEYLPNIHTKGRKGSSYVDATVTASYGGFTMTFFVDTYTAKADGTPDRSEESRHMKLYWNSAERQRLFVRLPKAWKFGQEIDDGKLRESVSELCKEFKKAVDSGDIAKFNGMKRLLDHLLKKKNPRQPDDKGETDRSQDP